jgi:hypothetical protein
MSRNVRVAGLVLEEGENGEAHRFALFTSRSTAILNNPEKPWQ